MHKLKRLRLGLHPHRVAQVEVVLALLIIAFVSTTPVSAVIRFQHRSLLVSNAIPGEVATYTLSMQYVSQVPIGSLDLLFCINPIPYEPCVPPTGLDVSGAVLASQQGEDGFDVSVRTSNHLTLSRPATVVTGGGEESKYVFENIINPDYKEHSFSIRLANFASEDATGPVINLGSVITQMTDTIVLQTQVPPQLIFCVSKNVGFNCSSATGGNYTDFGVIDPNDTLATQSQMAVGTNASGGFVITVNGSTMASGTKVINALETPTPSIPRTNQFGINVVANTDPLIGRDPDGDSDNAVAVGAYSIPNNFMFQDGDVIASAPNVSLIRRFTVSYIVNAAPSLKAGVYTTTITFVCSGRF